MKAVLAIIIATLVCWSVEAKPIVRGGGGGVVITLTDEPCALSAVTNLPYRATWVEKGKTYEGCFGISGENIAAYFDGKTVAVIPVEVFHGMDEPMKDAI